MNRAAAPLDLETIEAALGQFSVVVVNGGKRLFEEGRVRSLKRLHVQIPMKAEVYRERREKLPGHPFIWQVRIKPALHLPNWE